MRRCMTCKKEYVESNAYQMFCCDKCRNAYYRNTTKEQRDRDRKRRWPSVTFNCSQCGKTVVTEAGSMDKRSRFCCASCEKKFWRHPHWENPSVNIQFHSVDEYKSYEKRTNAE